MRWALKLVERFHARTRRAAPAGQVHPALTVLLTFVLSAGFSSAHVVWAAEAPPSPSPSPAPPQRANAHAAAAPSAARTSPLPEPVGAPSDTLTLTLPWSEPSGRGVALGYENGAWGRIWGQALRLKVPFGNGVAGQYWGALVRGLMLTEDVDDGADTRTEFHFGGRLEIYGQSDVILNVFRLYGGGGVQRFSNRQRLQHRGWGGGGQLGFEFFCSRAAAFFIEIGGHSGIARERDSHTLVIAGIQVYPASI